MALMTGPVVLITEDSAWWVRAYNRFHIRPVDDRRAHFQAQACVPIARALQAEGK